MQKRTLEKLILKDEDYIFEGNLKIKGYVIIENGSLTVSGNLIFNEYVNVKNGNITCGSIHSQNDIYITKGDIYVKENSYFLNVESDGKIEVGGNNFSRSIACSNFLVDGNNNSTFISTIEDVYILGSSDSYSINAREVFIDGNCCFNGYSLTAKYFEHGGDIKHCSYISYR